MVTGAGARSRRFRSWRWRLAGLGAGLIGFAAFAAWPVLHDPVLRAAGHALVAEDPARRADVIVIAVDADGAGVLEAADLVHAGVAPRVAIFSDPPDSVDREFLRRGVPYFNAAAVALQQLRSLGITDVEVIPRRVAGTEDEGQYLPQWTRARGYRTVLLVSLADHTRRTRRVLRRSAPAPGTANGSDAAQVRVRASRYSDFDPDHWWQSRAGVRTEFVEGEKLLLDVLRHPFG